MRTFEFPLRLHVCDHSLNVTAAKRYNGGDIMKNRSISHTTHDCDYIKNNIIKLAYLFYIMVIFLCSFTKRFKYCTSEDTPALVLCGMTKI